MSLGSLDRSLFSLLDASHAGATVTRALVWVAQGPVWLLPPLVACLWLARDRTGREAAVMAGAAAGLAMVAAHLASALVDRPRPFVVGLAPNLLDHAADSSFPSDHATLFFALAASFAFRPVPGARWLPWLLAFGGLGVGAARVALGVHFPVDVAGAALIGAAAALLAITVLDRPVRMLAGFAEHARATALRRLARHRPGSDAHPAG